MIHARYYQLVTFNGETKLQQALGSDSIMYLDEHQTPRGWHNTCVGRALMLNRKDGLNKGYAGYAIFKGRTVLLSTPRTTQIFPTAIEYVAVCEGQEAMI